MNIFDGYEDKSPEEVANKLGISDLSVIEKTEKEVIKTVEKKPKSEDDSIFDIQTLVNGNRIITCEDIKNKNELEIGKKVISSKGETGIITLVNTAGIGNCFTGISFFKNGKKKKSIAFHTFNELKNNFQIAKDNIIDDYQWKKPSNIGELQKEMLVKIGSENISILGKIIFIGDVSDTITVRNLSLDGVVNDDYSMEQFLEACHIGMKKESLIDSVRTDNCNYDDLEEGIRVRFLHNNSVGKIIGIIRETNEIYVWGNNGRKRAMNFKGLGTQFVLFKGDIERILKEKKFKEL